MNDRGCKYDETGSIQIPSMSPTTFTLPPEENGAASNSFTQKTL